VSISDVESKRERARWFAHASRKSHRPAISVLPPRAGAMGDAPATAPKLIARSAAASVWRLVDTS
jgi:hypothetical protein